MNRLPCDSNFLMEEAQELLTSNSEDRENCLFECSMILLKQWAKRLSLEFVDPVSVLSSGRKIFKHLLSWWKILKKRLTFNWGAVFFFATTHLFLEDQTLLCLQIAKLENFDYKKLFVGAFVISCFWVAGTGNGQKSSGKNNYFRPFLQKLLWYFFLKWKQSVPTGTLLFDRH